MSLKSIKNFKLLVKYYIISLHSPYSQNTKRSVIYNYFICKIFDQTVNSIQLTRKSPCVLRTINM